ncbi:DUF2971 domain-containing protein [Vibrio astriarenae]|uniref:DUF2971 domain-containing protein n=1 Tax=Vibrio astriarenae TaxID=1481923 RepID=UPI0037368C30
MAFISILKSKAFWATQLSKMNDPSEVIGGINALRQILSTRPNTKNENYNLEDCSKEVPFACSFSEDSDSLDQWRSYADDAKGVAIGINLKRIGWHSSYLVPIQVDVKYGKPSFEERVNNFLDDQDYIEKENNLEAFLKYERYAFKEDGYASEKEARLVVPVSIYDEQTPVHYKVDDTGLRKYIELKHSDVKWSSIEEVVIGPACKLTEGDIRFILKKESIPNADSIEIKKSKHNYRSK